MAIITEKDALNASPEERHRLDFEYKSWLKKAPPEAQRLARIVADNPGKSQRERNRLISDFGMPSNLLLHLYAEYALREGLAKRIETPIKSENMNKQLSESRMGHTTSKAEDIAGKLIAAPFSLFQRYKYLEDDPRYYYLVEQAREEKRNEFTKDWQKEHRRDRYSNDEEYNQAFSHSLQETEINYRYGNLSNPSAETADDKAHELFEQKYAKTRFLRRYKENAEKINEKKLDNDGNLNYAKQRYSQHLQARIMAIYQRELDSNPDLAFGDFVKSHKSDIEILIRMVGQFEWNKFAKRYQTKALHKDSEGEQTYLTNFKTHVIENSVRWIPVEENIPQEPMEIHLRSPLSTAESYSQEVPDFSPGFSEEPEFPAEPAPSFQSQEPGEEQQNQGGGPSGPNVNLNQINQLFGEGPASEATGEAGGTALEAGAPAAAEAPLISAAPEAGGLMAPTAAGGAAAITTAPVAAETVLAPAVPIGATLGSVIGIVLLVILILLFAGFVIYLIWIILTNQNNRPNYMVKVGCNPGDQQEVKIGSISEYNTFQDNLIKKYGIFIPLFEQDVARTLPDISATSPQATRIINDMCRLYGLVNGNTKQNAYSALFRGNNNQYADGDYGHNNYSRPRSAPLNVIYPCPNASPTNTCGYQGSDFDTKIGHNCYFWLDNIHQSDQSQLSPTEMQLVVFNPESCSDDQLEFMLNYNMSLVLYQRMQDQGGNAKALWQDFSSNVFSTSPLLPNPECQDNSSNKDVKCFADMVADYLTWGSGYTNFQTTSSTGNKAVDLANQLVIDGKVPGVCHSPDYGDAHVDITDVHCLYDAPVHIQHPITADAFTNWALKNVQGNFYFQCMGFVQVISNMIGAEIGAGDAASFIGKQVPGYTWHSKNSTDIVHPGDIAFFFNGGAAGHVAYIVQVNCPPNLKDAAGGCPINKTDSFKLAQANEDGVGKLSFVNYCNKSVCNNIIFQGWQSKN